MTEKLEAGMTRREALRAVGSVAAGAALASIGTLAQAAGDESTPQAKKAAKKSNTVPLNWKEVYYTNCPLVSASNVDQELGWTREEFKKIGVKYAFLRSVRENDWYPHYIHNAGPTNTNTPRRQSSTSRRSTSTSRIRTGASRTSTWCPTSRPRILLPSTSARTSC
jgi:hypothetical protein